MNMPEYNNYSQNLCLHVHQTKLCWMVNWANQLLAKEFKTLLIKAFQYLIDNSQPIIFKKVITKELDQVLQRLNAGTKSSMMKMMISTK
jgi:hypothetical protein